jgi:hypothetical protein
MDDMSTMLLKREGDQEEKGEEGEEEEEEGTGDQGRRKRWVTGSEEEASSQPATPP